MSYKRNSSICSLTDDATENTENSVIAKLRRLKIEENLLINNINKINAKDSEGSSLELPIFYGLQLKNYTGKLKNSLTEIKNMFGQLKDMAEENLSSADIDNMKRDVVKLDEKMRLIKSYVQSELALESSKETEFTKQMNDVEEKQSQCTFKPKIRIKQFNHFVPSPVKVMIQSPFKCKEVQDFQEFMSNSSNRYGGWNEYHHNVFVQIWQKYFKCNDIELNDAQEIILRNQQQFHAFQSEILEKIPGSVKDDIISHHKWYCKYLYLKEQQQDSLNKWKNNKRMLSKTRNIHDSRFQKRKMDPTSLRFNCEEEATSIENVKELVDTMDTCDAEEIANALCNITIQHEGSSFEAEMNIIGEDRSEAATKRNQRSFSDILKPTQQWNNRCNSSREGVKGYHDLDMIKKLRIPEWRMPLQD